MVHISIIEAQLSKLGFRASRWFKPEIRELQHILLDDEKLVVCAQGRYFGGFALLVATDRRLLLIDKKIPYLSIEDIRYDMIAEINYGSRWINSTINIYTVNKQHQFSSWKHKHHLRELIKYAQQRVMEMRQYQDNPSVTAQVVNRTPSLAQAYNYGQILHLQPPAVPFVERQRLPSPHMPRIMGATAVGGASRLWINPNPYTKGSFVMRKQWSNSSPYEA